MAGFHLFLLLAATLIATTSARSIPSRSSLSAPPPPTFGPIQLNGHNYTHVCDPNWFADLGLKMDDFAYCDKSLSYKDRVNDLISRMSLEEKIGLIGDTSYDVLRIGLPRYWWWSEALHGVAETGPGTTFGDPVKTATSFPLVILAAATFNESLWKKTGQVVSTEARAMYNLGQAGLTFWSPNINVVRDPRWGRALETPGEDTYTVGRFAVNYVRGLQDVDGFEVTEDLDSRPLKVAGCCKHFAAYDMDKWFFEDRHEFDARVTEQDMVETFMRPFEVCVKEGDVSSVMCSFNKVNGIPACADTKLMSQTFRDEWNLHGYIVSDCDSLDVIYNRMHWLNDAPEDAVAQTMKAGLDLACGYGQNYYMNHSLSAVAQGKMRESDIDNALKNLYVVLMRLGFFDNMPVYDSLGLSDICSKDNMELAADSARQGLVLLKNDNTLPLSPEKLKKIALVGPHGNTTIDMIGNYHGPACRYISPLDAFKADVEVDYEKGCDVVCNGMGSFPPAIKAAKEADATVIVAGLNIGWEAEEVDRSDLLLPGHQTHLIEQVAEASKGPVVLVVLSGGCLDLSFAQNNPKIGAIIWAGYPGQEGGQAIADVVFGRYNPGGRLPVTWYKNDYVDALPMISMQLRPVDEIGYPGRTYKFFNGSVLYPFGYGLSYTQFNYTVSSTHNSVTTKLDSLHLCKPLVYKPGVQMPICPSILIDDFACEDEIRFTVEVSNTGSLDGSHVVMVYSKAPAGVVGAPQKQLVAFERVFVPAKGVEKVEFSINACKALGIVEKTAYFVLPSGQHTIQIGDGHEAVSFPVDIKLQ